MKCIAFGCVNKDSDGLFAGQLCTPCFWKLTEGRGEYGTSVLFTSQARIRDLEAAVETGRTALTVSQDRVRELEESLNGK